MYRSNSSAIRKSIMKTQIGRKVWNTDERQLDMSLCMKCVWLALTLQNELTLKSLN